MDVIIPTVLNADLSAFYMVQDPTPGPAERYETREIVLKSLQELNVLKKQIIVLLMYGFKPKNIAKHLKTSEMSVTRAKRSFLANLQANGLEV